MRSLARLASHPRGQPECMPGSSSPDAGPDADADASGVEICCSNMLPRGSVRTAPLPRLWPNAALRSAPQFGQLSAFLRTVLPQRWQTTENMDAGNVKRVVMLEPSKDIC